MRGTVVIDANRCKGCELCTFVCPKHLLGMADTFTARGYRPAHLFDPRGDCTGCLLCAVVCPDVAITVYREDTRHQETLHDRRRAQNEAVPKIPEQDVQSPQP